MIYLNNTLGISKADAGVITAMVAPVLLLLALPIGRLTDRGHGFAVAFIGYVVSAIGFTGFSMTSSFFLLAIFGVLKSVGILMTIVMNMAPQPAARRRPRQLPGRPGFRRADPDGARLGDRVADHPDAGGPL